MKMRHTKYANTASALGQTRIMRSLEDSSCGRAIFVCGLPVLAEVKGSVCKLIKINTQICLSNSVGPAGIKNKTNGVSSPKE